MADAATPTVGSSLGQGVNLSQLQALAGGTTAPTPRPSPRATAVATHSGAVPTRTVTHVVSHGTPQPTPSATHPRHHGTPTPTPGTTSVATTSATPVSTATAVTTPGATAAATATPVQTVVAASAPNKSKGIVSTYTNYVNSFNDVFMGPAVANWAQKGIDDAFFQPGNTDVLNGIVRVPIALVASNIPTYVYRAQVVSLMNKQPVYYGGGTTQLLDTNSYDIIFGSHYNWLWDKLGMPKNNVLTTQYEFSGKEMYHGGIRSAMTASSGSRCRTSSLAATVLNISSPASRTISSRSWTIRPALTRWRPSSNSSTPFRTAWSG